MSTEVCNLSQIVQAEINVVSQSESFWGPIMPRWIVAAIPPMGKRQSKKTLIAILYIVEILSAYRPKSGAVFWQGPLYKVNRKDMADRFCCHVDDISEVQTHFETHGWIIVDRRSNWEGDQPRGSMTYVMPNARVIDAALRKAQNAVSSAAAQAPPTTLKDGCGQSSKLVRPTLQRGASLKASATRRKAGEATASRGDGRSGFEQHASPVGSPACSVGSGTAQQKSDEEILINLFREGIDRAEVNSDYTVSKADANAARSYLQLPRAASPFTLVAVALRAWELGAKHRTKFHFGCSVSTLKDLCLNFNRVIGALRAKWDVGFDALNVLRRYFTPSELIKLGMGSSTVLENEHSLKGCRWLWEAKRNTIEYYTSTNLPFPVELSSFQSQAANEIKEPAQVSTDLNPPQEFQNLQDSQPKSKRLPHANLKPSIRQKLRTTSLISEELMKQPREAAKALTTPKVNEASQDTLKVTSTPEVNLSLQRKITEPSGEREHIAAQSVSKDTQENKGARTVDKELQDLARQAASL